MTFEEQIEQIRKSNDMIDPKGLKWGKMDLSEQIAFLSTPEALVGGHGQWWVTSVAEILTDLAPLLDDVEASLRLLKELDDNHIALQSKNAENEALPYGFNANFYAERSYTKPKVGFDKKGKEIVLLAGPKDPYRYFQSEYDLHITEKNVYFTHKETGEMLPFEKWTDEEKKRLVEFIKEFPFFKKALDNFIEDLGNQPKVYATVEKWDVLHYRGQHNKLPYLNGTTFFIPEAVYKDAVSPEDAKTMVKEYIVETYEWQKRSDSKGDLTISEMYLRGINDYLKGKGLSEKKEVNEEQEIETPQLEDDEIER